MLRSEPTPSRARLGVSAMFFTNGVIFSALLPRYPEIKDTFELSNSAFGLLVVAFPVGAALGALFAGRAIRALSAPTVTALGTLLVALALTAAGFSPVVWLFAGALVLAGALDAIVDAAQNVQGVLVEQWRERSVINSLHALWSIGAATGGLIGAAAVAVDLSIGLQMAINGALWSVVAAVSSYLSVVPDEVRARIRSDSAQESSVAVGSPGARRHAWRLLAPLVVLAFCGTLIEDVANNWVVLFLAREAGAPAAVAGLGLTVVLGAQFVGRLLGDPMTDRWGREAVARSGGVIIAVGALLAMFSPAYPVAVLGFALTGLGCATLVPAAFAAAGRVPGLPEGTGIAVIGWLMRLGFLVTSPAIGRLSDATSLSTAMVIPVAAGLLAALVASVVGRHAAARPRTA